MIGSVFLLRDVHFCPEFSMQSRSIISFSAVCLALLPLLASAQKAAVYITIEDRVSLLAPAKQSAVFHTQAPGRIAIEVDPAQSFQTIDGFGFAVTGGSAVLLMRMDPSHRQAILQELFGHGKEDIGVSYIRISIGSSDMNDHVFSYDDMPAGSTDLNLEHFDLGPDNADVIPVVREILAIHPGIQILASPWSAPAWMKTNGKVKDGSLKPEYYAAYAQYLVRYVQGMKAAGVPISALTVQNEPLNGNNTPSMIMTAEEEGKFIRENLGPAFGKARIQTKIILYDHNCDRPDYPLTILADAAAAQYAAGSGFHLYEGDVSAMTKVHEAYPDKQLYFTEQMVVDNSNEPKLNIAAPVKRVLIGATRNWSRNVLLWNLAADPQFGPHTNDGGCPVCEGAITLDGNRVQRNVAYYVIAHASRFVPATSRRIGSTEPANITNVAFETPSGKTVLIVANDCQTPKKFQIHYRGKIAETSLDARAVATYVW
jgi:glucosylceramidase